MLHLAIQSSLPLRRAGAIVPRLPCRAELPQPFAPKSLLVPHQKQQLHQEQQHQQIQHQHQKHQHHQQQQPQHQQKLTRPQLPGQSLHQKPHQATRGIRFGGCDGGIVCSGCGNSSLHGGIAFVGAGFGARRPAVAPALAVTAAAVARAWYSKKSAPKPAVKGSGPPASSGGGSGGGGGGGGGGGSARSKSRRGYGQEGVLVCSLTDVSKPLSLDKYIFQDVRLSFWRGAKIGVLGVNGSGKSSLLKIIAGVDKDFEGELRFASDIDVGYLAQEPALDPTKDVKENVLQGVAEKLRWCKRFQELQARADANEIGDDLAELETLRKRMDQFALWGLEAKVERAMDALRCPPGDWAVENLSGGERRRVALCRLLVSQPDVLLLDEPTNHLDAESVAWLERYLSEYPGAVLAVTHDRYFLDNVAGWILEIDRGRMYPFLGNYTEWLEQKQQRLALEAKQESIQGKAMKRELEWIQAGVRGRQAKSKARIAAYDEMCAQARSAAYEPGTILLPSGPRLGRKVVVGTDVTLTAGDKLLVQRFSFNLEPGAVVGIIGPNGAGKSTLLRAIAGEIEPDEGTLVLGETVEVGYVSQSRDELDPDNTVYEEITEGSTHLDMGGGRSMVGRAYVSSFNFKGPDQEKLVEMLSGGERNRVHIAKMLKRGCNLLLLDEPTNDLDVDVLRALEAGLADFAGCAIIVSHDRWFLDRLCTHIIALDGAGEATYFAGNYSDYEKDRLARLGSKFDPHRTREVKYKPIKM